MAAAEADNGWVIAGGSRPPRAAPVVRVPAPVPLRPLGVGEVLDGAISLMRANPRLMFGVPFLVAVAASAVAYALAQGLRALSGGWTFSDPAGTGSLVAALVALTPVVLVAGAALLLLSALLTYAAGRAVLGEGVDLRTAWAGVRPRVLSLLARGALLLLLAAGMLMVLFGPGVLLSATSPGGGTALLVLGGLAVLPAAAMLGCTAALTVPVVVLEQRRPVAAVRRAYGVTRGIRLRCVGLWLLSGLVSSVLGLVLSQPLQVLSLLVGITPAGDHPALEDALLALANAASLAVTLPFTALTGALIYLDARMRREGLDLHLAPRSGGAP